MGVTFEEAEAYKLGIDVPAELESEIPGILRSVSENLTLEIEKTFDYFKTTTYSQDIQKLYVCGGACKTSGLKDYLAESFQFPVEYLDPFKKITLNSSLPGVDDTEHFASDYAVAVGLALRTA